MSWGEELSDPAFEGFWAAAERLGALVMIHPNGFTEGQRFKPLLLQQCPRQSVGYHGGAALPNTRRRAGTPPWPQASRGAWRRLPARPIPGASTMPGARGPTAATTCRNRRRITCARCISTASSSRRTSWNTWCRVFGADRILMGTDFPFDMAESDPIGHICAVAGEALARRQTRRPGRRQRRNAAQDCSPALGSSRAVRLGPRGRRDGPATLTEDGGRGRGCRRQGHGGLRSLRG